jgi:predicted small secreted protein
MSAHLRILSLLSLLLAVLGLAACGGGDDDRDAKNAYVAQVNAAQTAFASNVTTVSQRITPKSSSSQDRKTLEGFESAIEDVVSKLRDIKVPGDVEAEHKQLVDAMTGFGADIKTATVALRNPDTRSIADAQRGIATATQTVNSRIDAAIAAINSKLGAK